MRGKARSADSGNLGVGITPAHAGKRDKTAMCEEWCRDHPCVCGEKTKPVPAGGILMGSPPRVRGKGPAGQILVVSVGITPAYAGKRCRSPAFRSMPWDHPRVCGEKLSTTSTDIHPAGSPSRVRGKGGRTGSSGRYTGITPAYAGKSRWSRGRAALGRITPACAGKSRNRCEKVQRGRDHPRVCGEKTLFAMKVPPW